MSLVSISFLIFFFILLIVYYVVPSKWQVYVLALANIVFYAFEGIKCIPFIIGTCVFSFTMGLSLEQIRDRGGATRANIEDKQERKIHKQREKRLLRIVEFFSIIVLLALWMAVKFSCETIPLGISFYIFIAISYVVDVYREKYVPEHSIFKYSAFMCFFPQLTQGPFSRYDVLGKSMFEEHRFSRTNLKNGILMILWGLIKKTVIGYRLGLVCNKIMSDGDESAYRGVFILILAICLVLELYADFSGYMDIVTGLSLMLGIRLQQNFKQPIFSKSVEEIWHRWHITLGEWFKEYVFYPVSTNKLVQKISKSAKNHFSTEFARSIPVYIALVFVWTATGLWHGLAWKYLAWGWLNLFFIVEGIALKEHYQRLWRLLRISDSNKALNIFRMIRTFFIFCFMELVSSAPSFGGAIRWIKSLIFEKATAVDGDVIAWIPGIDWIDFAVILIGLLLILLVDILHEKGISVIESTNRWKVLPRYMLYVGCIYVVLLFGEIGENVTFMYAQF